MRKIIVAAVWLLGVCIAIADERDAANPVPWRPAFSSISSTDKSTTSIAIVITNDQPWSKQHSGDQPTTPGHQHSTAPTVWSADLILEAFAERLRVGGQSKTVIELQAIAAGLPAELTGDGVATRPPQSVIALCDGHYRLLSIAVGVPDASELGRMLKDAHEVRRFVNRYRDDPQTTIHRLVDRQRPRLGRLWRDALDGLSQASVEDDDLWRSEPSEMYDRIHRVYQDLQPTYLLDTELRFERSSGPNSDRLRVLEQHVETRRPWCETILPFVAGLDFRIAWRPIVESIWELPPITAAPTSPEMLAWIDAQSEVDSVVLQLQPAMTRRHLRWPPVFDSASPRPSPWQAVHDLALEHHFRLIDVNDLALLIRNRQWKAIDIYEPSPVRYLFLDPTKREPLVVRENDPPSRFGGTLKRSKSALVKN